MANGNVRGVDTIPAEVVVGLPPQQTLMNDGDIRRICDEQIHNAIIARRVVTKDDLDNSIMHKRGFHAALVVGGVAVGIGGTILVQRIRRRATVAPMVVTPDIAPGRGRSSGS